MALPTVTLDDETKRAIQHHQKEAENDAADEHKYSILKDMLERTYAPFLAELQKDEVLKMNDIEAHYRLIPIVWRRRLADGTLPPLVQKCMELYREHCYDHRVNTSSINRKRESAIAYSLKNDGGPGLMDKQLASFIRK